MRHGIETRKRGVDEEVDCSDFAGLCDDCERAKCTLRVVHAVEAAANADAAIVAFTRSVAEKFPAYALVDTIADPIPVVCRPTEI